jgi:hypothetical protein
LRERERNRDREREREREREMLLESLVQVSTSNLAPGERIIQAT